MTSPLKGPVTHQQLIEAMQASGAINLNKLGDVVSAVTPQLLDPGVAADDYVARVASSVIAVVKMTPPAVSGIEQISQLRGIAQQARQAGEATNG